VRREAKKARDFQPKPEKIEAGSSATREETSSPLLFSLTAAFGREDEIRIKQIRNLGFYLLNIEVSFSGI